MKLVVTSDWHGDRETLGVPRFGEVALAVAKSVGMAVRLRQEHDVVYLCLCDLADPESGGWTSRVQALAITVACDLAELGIPSVWVAGNHDVHDDGTGATILAPLAALAARLDPLFVFEQPGKVTFGDVDLVCLPYAPLATSYDPAVEVKKLLDPKMRTIVAAHLMVQGVVPGEETLEMPRGRDVVFPVAETEQAVLRLNGHYHKRQTTPEGIVIPGSLARLTFGEEAHEPSFLVIDV